MQALFPLLVMWLIASFITRLTRAAREQQKKAAPARPAAAPARPKAAAPRPAPAAPVMPAQPHVAVPLEAHMHEPVMGEEGVGTEGIDCCHEYMLDQPQEAPADFLPLTEESQKERAQALLQGVIFSEILGRRAPRRIGGRRA